MSTEPPPPPCLIFVLPSSIDILLATARSRQRGVQGFLRACCQCKAQEGSQSCPCLMWSPSSFSGLGCAFWLLSWPSQCMSPTLQWLVLQGKAGGGSNTGAACRSRILGAVFSALWGECRNFSTQQAKPLITWGVPPPSPALFLRHCQSRSWRSCLSWTPGDS